MVDHRFAVVFLFPLLHVTDSMVPAGTMTTDQHHHVCHNCCHAGTQTDEQGSAAFELLARTDVLILEASG